MKSPEADWMNKYKHTTVVLWFDKSSEIDRFTDWLTNNGIVDFFSIPRNELYNPWKRTIVFTDEKAYVLFCLSFQKIESGVTAFPYYSFPKTDRL